MTSILTKSTLLIGFHPSTGQYDSKGWVVANDTDILKEAIGMWHYEFEGHVKGPISCRELSQLYRRQEAIMEQQQQPQQQVTMETRVWSSELGGGEWKKIHDCPNLQIAMEAFIDTPLPFELQSNPKEPFKSSTSHDDRTKANDTIIQNFNDEMMVYDDPEGGNPTNTTGPEESLLTDFFSSTAGPDIQEEEEVEEYQSDGGTTYIRKKDSDQWMDSKLVPPTTSLGRKRKLNGANSANGVNGVNVHSDTNHHKENRKKDTAQGGVTHKKKKASKAKFRAKNAKCWIYVTNLPSDTTALELSNYFSKVGILDLNPETQKPKIKLYRYKKGQVMQTPESSGDDTGAKERLAKGGEIKGDASICYARPESVQLALQFLDDSIFRPSSSMDNDIRISVKPAKFEQHGDLYQKKRSVSNVKRKVCRLAALQAIGWDEDGDNGRITGGLKGLRIIVLKAAFTLSILQAGNEDEILKELEQGLHEQCSQYGTVEKITIFSKNPEGVVIVKFTQPTAASQAVAYYNGKIAPKNFGGKEMEAVYWDGVTDYTVKDLVKEEKETNQRLDEFGDWLDNQEVPDEFQLQVET